MLSVGLIVVSVQLTSSMAIYLLVNFFGLEALYYMNFGNPKSKSTSLTDKRHISI